MGVGGIARRLISCREAERESELRKFLHKTTRAFFFLSIFFSPFALLPKKKTFAQLNSRLAPALERGWVRKVGILQWRPRLPPRLVSNTFRSAEAGSE